MADTTKLYSLDGATPALLPSRFVTPTGQIRTAPDQWTAAELTAWGFVQASAAPSFNATTHNAPVWNGSAWTTAAKTLDERRAAGITAAQVRRREIEIGGMIWVRSSDSAAFGIATDVESQGKLTAARAAAVSELRSSGAKWKCQNSSGDTVFEAFSDADMVLIANAALAHVQSAYDREAAIVAALTAATTTTAMAAAEALIAPFWEA
jgi:hypothetical protein